jgi:hypothetical protein
MAGYINLKTRWQRVTTDDDPDRASLWFNLFLQSGSGPVSQDRLRSLLDGAVNLPAVQLSEDLRWKILLALSMLGVSDYGSLLSVERERDPSDQGEKFAIATDAAQPEAHQADVECSDLRVSLAKPAQQ